MPKTATIRFEFDTDRDPEVVVFSLDDHARQILNAYVREAIILENIVLGFEPQSTGFSMSARVGGPVTFTGREPSVLERAALLHHLRPFVLDDEPFAFHKTRGIIARSSENAFLQGRLKELKRMFGGLFLAEQMRITSGGVLVNSESTLRRWLNAFEYHRDGDKAEQLENSLGSLPEGMTRPLFFMLLFQKSDAVRYLGDIAFKMVNAWGEIETRDV